jgi:hypothetical protein
VRADFSDAVAVQQWLDQRTEEVVVNTTLMRAVVALFALGVGAAAAAAAADSTASRTPIDGVYRFQITVAELRAGADPSEINDGNYGRFTAVFDREHFVITPHNERACTLQYGNFRLTGNRLRLSFVDGGGVGTKAYNRPGESFTYSFTVSRSALTLKAIPGTSPPTPLRLKPWLLVFKTPKWMWLGAGRCAPPRKALPQ